MTDAEILALAGRIDAKNVAQAMRLDAECAKLEEENARLRERVAALKAFSQDLWGYLYGDDAGSLTREEAADEGDGLLALYDRHAALLAGDAKS